MKYKIQNSDFMYKNELYPENSEIELNETEAEAYKSILVPLPAPKPSPSSKPSNKKSKRSKKQ